MLFRRGSGTHFSEKLLCANLSLFFSGVLLGALLYAHSRIQRHTLYIKGLTTRNHTQSSTIQQQDCQDLFFSQNNPGEKTCFFAGGPGLIFQRSSCAPTRAYFIPGVVVCQQGNEFHAHRDDNQYCHQVIVIAELLQ